MDDNSRVQVLDHPQVDPAYCVMCRTGGGVDGRKFIDFGLQLEFFGAVIFCTYCIAPVAEACGYVPQLNYKALETKYEQEYKISSALTENNRILSNAMVGLLQCNLSSIGSADELVAGILSALEKSSKPATGKQQADKSTSEQGSKRVRSPANTG